MQVALTTASYESRSIISDAQKCVNLYIEQNPPDSPYPFTHYPTPGLKLLSTAPVVAEVRGLYTASNGHLYGVVANTLYDISSGWAFTSVGTISSSSGQVSMQDNELCMVLVDGSPNGWVIDLSNNNFAAIVSDAFYGANKVDFMDTYFLFNRPNSNEFYSSLSNVTFADMTGGPILTGAISAAGTSYTSGSYPNVTLTGGSGTGAIADITVSGGGIITVTIIVFGDDYVAGDVLSAPNSALGGTGSGFTWTVASVGTSAFDPLFIAATNGAVDPVNTLAVVHREIQIFGFTTTEVWYDAGAADFPFQIMPGAFIEHGCAATYSPAKWDLSIFFLGQDSSGNSVVFEYSAYRVRIVSSRAVANSINAYAIKSDAIGFTYMQSGHAFYVLTFPSQDVTWVYDITEQHWHQRAWIDSNGQPHRWRPNCRAVFNNTVVTGDFQNGNLYAVDLDTYQDNGQPIVRIRSFPHLIKEGNRVTYWNILAQFQVGEMLTPNSPDIPFISLKWSDDYGRTYSNAMEQSLGATGEYLTSVQYNRLGIARDRVFQFSWSSPMKTALNGVYVQIEESSS